MEVIDVNSTTVAIHIPKTGFQGSENEVAKYAQEIGQYGNITAYAIDYTDAMAIITYKLMNKKLLK